MGNFRTPAEEEERTRRGRGEGEERREGGERGERKRRGRGEEEERGGMAALEEEMECSLGGGTEINRVYLLSVLCASSVPTDTSLLRHAGV